MVYICQEQEHKGDPHLLAPVTPWHQDIQQQVIIEAHSQSIYVQPLHDV